MITLPKKTTDYCDEKINVFRGAKMWDAPKSEIVGVLTGYELIKTQKDCGGYCDYQNGIIAINNKWWETFTIGTMFHEIAHSFKADLEAYRDENRLLSAMLLDEIETDVVSKYMLDRLYPGAIPDDDVLNYKWSEKDAKFLLDWYGDWAWDDLNLKK